MAKNNQQESQQEQVATTVSGVEEFFKKNQKWIEWALIALLVIILGIFAYNRWVVAPARAEAQGQLFRGPVLLSLPERSPPVQERSLLLPQSFPPLRSFPEKRCFGQPDRTRSLIPPTFRS